MGEALQIQILRIGWSRFQHNLVLKIMLQPIRIITIPAIRWPSTRLDVGCPPRFGPNRPQKRGRIKGSRTLFRIIRLDNDAVVRLPKLMKGENNLLKRHNARLLTGNVLNVRPSLNLGYYKISSNYLNLPKLLTVATTL